MSRYKTISGASKPTSGACKLRSSHWIHLDNHKRQSTFQKKLNLNSPCTIQYQVLLQMKRPLQNKNNGQQQEWFHFSVEFPSMICKTIPNTCFKTMWAHAYVTCTTLFPIQQILRRYKCSFMNKGKISGNQNSGKWNLNSYSKQQSVSSSKPQEHGCVIEQAIMLNF